MICCDVSRPRLFPRQHAFRFDWPNPDEQIVHVCDSALLTGLSPQDCSEILSCARIKAFARNERLFSQDQPIDKLLLIRTGSVKLTQLTYDGKEAILWMNGPGDTVGMLAYSVSSKHSCSAHAIERCQIFVWEHKLLKELIARYPQIQINLERILASRLRDLEERFCEIASERIPKRLALVLLRLLKSVGKKSRDGVELGLTREELAQMTGTTHFTISRILSRWAAFGFIVARREGVVISDPDRLRCLDSVPGRMR
jgi:CRP-like cAMP-binding protein